MCKLLEKIAEEYRDLNGISIQSFNGKPTPLEFSRMVHISRPVVFRGCWTKEDLPALAFWSDEHLEQIMGDSPISVAVTPHGQADSLISHSDGKTYFVEPHSQKMTMSELLEHLKHPTPNSGVYYLQSQNGNIYVDAVDVETELKKLGGWVPGDVAWVNKALGRPPDAVNVWIGNERSATSAHSDPYENIYTVIRGSKHFTLLPPTEGWCLEEKLYPHATYTRNENNDLELTPSPPSHHQVPWPSLRAEEAPQAHPITVTLNPGDTLYLPPGWLHQVKQSGDPHICVAVNWWYDMEMRGSAWTWLNFLRGAGHEDALLAVLS